MMLGGMIKALLKKFLAKRGLAIVPSNTKCSLGYISAEETVSAARREGLSVCDYVEKLWGKEGDTQKVIEQMASYHAFEMKQPSVLEIGAGTGRYMEKIFAICKPAKYESYETAQDWASWLTSKYPIISHNADGISLKQTPDNSIDLLHAHGVFVYLPFLVSCRYFKEIWRVMRNEGRVVFDIISENCLDDKTVEKWFVSGENYPCFLSKNYIVSLFAKNRFSLEGSFMNRYGEGMSEYLVFKLGINTDER